MDTKLSQNFYLSEFTKSETAIINRIQNIPNQSEIANLKALCENILQPTRDHFGKAIVVSSGFRNSRVNRLVGSNDSSQHRLGQAVDFEIPGLSNLEVSKWVVHNTPFDQLILEYYDGKNPNSGWIHCSFSSRHRKQSMVFNGGRYRSISF